MQSKIEFYNQERFVNDPCHPAGFAGTWNFSDHSLIPDVFHEFLQRHFGQYKIRRIPLNKINQLLNDLWEGPGSLEKIFRLEKEYLQNGKKIPFTASDIENLKNKDDEDDEDEIFEDLDFDLIEDIEEDD